MEQTGFPVAGLSVRGRNPAFQCQGVNAVKLMSCCHETHLVPSLLPQGLYCVGDSTFPGQGVNAVVFSGFGCAHRVLCDLGLQPTLPGVDGAYNSLLSAARDAA